MIDLSAAHLELVEEILLKRVPFARARVFGSRVAGTSVEYSDLDLAIEAEKRMDLATIGHLKMDFEESPLPFRVDVLDFNALSPEFKKAIESHCELLAPRRFHP